MITIQRFSGSPREWDGFVAESANGTFLLTRPYMDYHADRFSDFSLAAAHDGKPIALLPANAVVEESLLQSHGGLTYGGWIVPCRHFNGETMLAIFDEWLKFCKAEGFKAIDYKPIPHIYHRRPAEDDIYALFRCNAGLTECNLSSTIDLSQPLLYNQMQRRHLKKASEIPGLKVGEERDPAQFWETLTVCLRERHGVAPVHSLEEIRLLQSRFPDNIHLFTATTPVGALAGVMVYDTGIVAHAQYIAANDEARCLNLLPVLFHWLTTERFAHRRYFDFGISNENHGLILNSGLLAQKTSLGGSGTVYSRYRITL